MMPKPLSGVNFYRVKQVDKDGNFKYSKTVRVNLNLVKIGVSVLANPFHNSLIVDFTSATQQAVFARLIDITGKQVLWKNGQSLPEIHGRSFPISTDCNKVCIYLILPTQMVKFCINNKVIKQ